IKLKQIHSSIIVDIDDTSAASDAVTGDAVVSPVRDAALAVQTADCVPILIADADGRAIAAVHAGWRGTAARIAEGVVRRLVDRFDINPKSLFAAIGPHIGVCCYEVGDDVVSAISDESVFEMRPNGAKPHLNLSSANQRQLVASGIPAEQIEV